MSVMEITRDTFVHGSAWVSLAPIGDPALVLPGIAHALEVPDVAGQPLLERITTYLAQRDFLLVLDNLEHMLDVVAPLIDGLLSTCPGLVVATTSRVRLGMTGERVVPVGPLDAETARALFVARAEAVDPTFVGTAGNAPVIEAICDRLDRLPLAIELAAARVAVLPPPALLARLERRLDLLTGGPRNAPARLRTMRDTIAWSHDLLPEPEQVLFRRIAVFVGGFTLEAASANAGDSNVLEGISVLIAASLVMRIDEGLEEPRYSMLETIREFGIERLMDSEEEESIRCRHAMFYCALAERASEFWDTADELHWVGRLEAEDTNLRGALVWLSGSADTEARLHMVAAMSKFWFRADHWAEGRHWMEQAVAWSTGDRTPQRVKILNGSWMVGGEMSSELINRCQEALEIALELGDKAGEVGALSGFTFAARHNDDLDEANRLFEEILTMLHEHSGVIPGVEYRLAKSLTYFAVIAHRRGDHARARRLAEDALEQQRNLGFTYEAGESLLMLAVISYDQGDLAGAVTHCQMGLGFAWPGTELWLVAALLDRLAIIAGETGQAQPAAVLGGLVEQLHERLGTKPNPAEDKERMRARASARAHVTELDFASAWANGRLMSIDDAVNLSSSIVVPDLKMMGTSHLTRTHGSLTHRELEVLRLIAAGRSNKEIAATLFISVPTVKRHVTTILSKLDLPSRSAATAYAHTHALL
jgi:non-specific serine/threonine protein kinase